MLFNSIEFALFLPVVFALYWLIPGRRLRERNLLLLVASYLFYGWWDVRFLALIFISSLVDFLIGMGLGKSGHSGGRKLLVLISLMVNLGILGVFKYYNFFVSAFADAFSLFGRSFSPGLLHIVLPVGISFYTFQTLSYSLDVYRRQMEPCRDGLAFFAYVSFFPQLVAGPIERAHHLLPQFKTTHKFDPIEVADGLRQMLWGLVKKMVIADNCAPFVNAVFSAPDESSGAALLIGTVLFAFQIYGDFSGYSDIAIGTAKLFGFDLMRNFAYPYFSRDIAEFWRRWHISLTTWFRDYVYIPFGGNRKGAARAATNTFIVFLLSGLWHGADWTFVIWGALNALFFLPLMLSGRHRLHVGSASENRLFPHGLDFVKIGLTFLLVCTGWVFFRAESVADALLIFRRVASSSILIWNSPAAFPWTVLLLTGGLVLIEWFCRRLPHPLAALKRFPRPIRWIAYYMLLSVIYFFGGAPEEFIYFQF